jgi:periplasmic protein CpxP/Spy
MKKLGLLLLLALFATTFSMAQQGGPQNFDPKEMAKRQTEELTKELGLNKDQQKKVSDLNLKAAEQMSAMREQMRNGGDREAMREKMTKAREAQNAEMKKILTDEQYKKYEKYLEERRARRGGPGGPGGQR